MASDYVAAYCECGVMKQVPRHQMEDYMCPDCRKEKSRLDTIRNSHFQDNEESEYLDSTRFPADRELDFN